jgi:DNA-binding Lrp family transcriptional regulator
MRNNEDDLSLDRIDRALMVALQQDARITNKDLAARVGLAESTCLERVRRLTARGVLRGFHAEIDLRTVGVGLQALVSVRLARHTRKAFQAFRRSMLGLEQAVAVFHVAGSNDFLVHVAVRDSDALRELILDRFTSRPEVAHVETSLIYEHARNVLFGGAPGDPR